MSLTRLRDFVIPGDEEVFKQNAEWYNSIVIAIAKIEPMVIVEFGTRAGYSAKLVQLLQPKATIYSYDGNVDEVSKDYFEHAKKIVPGLQFELINTSELEQIPSCDLVLVDADHTYEGCVHELNLALAFSKNVLVDDLIGPGVMRAIGKVVEKFPLPIRMTILNNRAVLLEKQLNV